MDCCIMTLLVTITIIVFLAYLGLRYVEKEIDMKGK